MKQVIKSIYLKPGKERAIINRHPWLFSGAVLKKDANINAGDEVLIHDHQGHELALGHWCGNDGLVCRIMTFDVNLGLNEDFFNDRFNKARALRHALLSQQKTNGYRLIHGEGDGLSGLVCDIFAETASIQLSNPGLKKVLSIFCDFLVRHVNIKNIHLTDAASGESSWLLGHNNNTPFLENSLSFVADIDNGQKTGHFLDQRDNRQSVKEWAQHRDVLDSFCYSGGFSVYALAGGARTVTSVDIAEKAISSCQQNVRANGFDAGHHAVVADCFSYLRQIKKDDFDLIILDPPAFAKSSQAVERAARGYKDINLLAMKAIRSGGVLFTFSCSQHIDDDLFQKIIFAAAKDAGREVKIVKKLTQGVDHPVSVYCPQSHYLKGLALYVE
jgi:23S rRNA (cytosine1962-C5)-methyltransferase